jgi:hypothetical protein
MGVRVDRGNKKATCGVRALTTGGKRSAAARCCEIRYSVLRISFARCFTHFTSSSVSLFVVVLVNQMKLYWGLTVNPSLLHHGANSRAKASSSSVMMLFTHLNKRDS